MPEHAFEKYGDWITPVVTEAVACTPETWKGGTLSIACDGAALSCTLENPGLGDTVEASPELCQRCAELYAAMYDAGDDWGTATLQFSPQEDGEWDLDMQFEEAEPSAPSRVTAEESSRRKGVFGRAYDLAIYATIGGAYPLAQEAPVIHERFVTWLRERGAECGSVVFSVVAPPVFHEEIRAFITRMVGQPLGFDAVLSHLEIALELTDPATGESERLKIKWQPPVVPAADVVEANAEMEEQARAAIEMVQAEYGKHSAKLDFSESSIGAVEAMLTGFAKDPDLSEEASAQMALRFGAYLGEIARRQFPEAAWCKAPGKSGASLRLGHIEIFPVAWCYKQLSDPTVHCVVEKYLAFRKTAAERGY